MSGRDVERDVNDRQFLVNYRSKNMARFDLVLRGYSVFGVLLSIIAFGYFLVTFLDIHLTEPQLFSLILSGSGLALSGMSFLLLLYRRQRDREEIDKLQQLASTAELIHAWSNFEQVARRILSTDGNAPNRYSLTSIISKLSDTRLITDSDVSILREALDVRNMVVHGHGIFPIDRLAGIVMDINDIVRRMSGSRLNHEER